MPRSNDGGDDSEEDEEVDGAETAAIGAQAAIGVLEEALADAVLVNAVEDGENEEERADGDAEEEAAASVLVRIEATLFVVGVDTNTESSKLSCNSAS